MWYTYSLVEIYFTRKEITMKKKLMVVLIALGFVAFEAAWLYMIRGV